MTVVGSGEIQITPLLTGFEAALRTQLQPILARVEAQIAPMFSRVGGQAAQAFGKDFSAALQTQVGQAAKAAAGSRGIADAGTEMGARFGKGLTVEAGSQIGRGLRDGVDRATSGVSSQVKQAGVTSGRTFGSGFGEGFAALAAFAIAARVKRFFEETVQAAVRFETEFAGAVRVVGGTTEQLDGLRTSIINMSERLPFAAEGIAKVAAEAGRLGVQRDNIESFTETILKFATITGQAPEAAATAFAKFATVTQTSLSESEHLADVVLELGTAFAANETEILEFTRRLAPLAALTRASAEDVLAFATGIVQAGGRAEAGSTAITQSFDKMIAAAQAGGVEALKFAKVLGVDTVEAFTALIETDPTEAFVRLLEGLQREGARSGVVLDELGLGSQRVGVQLRALAASSEAVRDALEATEGAAGELSRQFDIFSATPAARLKVLQNELENTRIAIGGKLAIPLINLLKPIAALDTATVGLVATFAGLAATAFAFVRFGNIINQFRSTLGAGALSAGEFSGAMQIARASGLSLSAAMKVLRQQELTVVEAQTLLAASDEKSAAARAKLIAGLRATKVETASYITLLKAAAVEQAGFTATQGIAIPTATALATAQKQAAIQIVGTASSVRSAEVALRFAGAGSKNLADALALQATAANKASGSLLEAARTAGIARGGFGSLVEVIGKLSIFALVADFATQALVGLRGFVDEAVRGKENIDAITVALQKLAFGVGSVEDVFEKARLDVSGLGDAFITAGDSVGNSFIGPLSLGAELFSQLGDAGIPVISQIAGALGTVDDAFENLLNEVPLLGRAITTSAEEIEKRFADLNAGLLRVMGEQGPEVARGVAELVRQQLEGLGRSTEDVDEALKPFDDALKAAGEAAGLASTDFETAKRSLERLGLTPEQVAAALQTMNIAAEGSVGALAGVAGAAEAAESVLSRLAVASQAFNARVLELSNPIAGIIEDQNKLAKSGRAAAKDTTSSARAIADAERALAEAREDAARRIADAQRAITEAEEDAARRIADARQRLADSRLDSSRSLRDAQQELQDFEAALARVGGARTAEDEIRLRELREAVSDTTQDAIRAESEGRRNVAEAEEEGAERIAEARRKLAQAEEDAAEKIEEALLRLARAHEDAAKRSQKAAADTADAITATTRQLTAGFAEQARKLTLFSSLLTGLVPRVVAAFGGDFDLAEVFLAQLAKMGVDAIPILQNLNKSSKTELAKLAKTFGDQIRAAKKAADIKFDEMPDNFAEKTKTAIDALVVELDVGLREFDRLPDKGGAVAALMGEKLKQMALDMKTFADETGVQLTEAERHLLHLALTTENPITRVAKLKELIEKLKSRNIVIDVTVKTKNLGLLEDLASASPQLKRNILAGETQGHPGLDPNNPLYVAVVSGARIGAGALGKTVIGPFAQTPRAQFGSTMAAGMPVLVGKHTAEELFIPSTAGAIFKHSDTERILRALRVARQSGGNNIVVNEVAEDPLATARAVSFAIGSGGAVR